MLLCAQYVIPIVGEPIKDGAVLVDGDTILDVGPATSMKLRYADEEIHDYGQSALLPGFVSVHTHLENTVMRDMVHDEPYVGWLANTKEIASRLDIHDWQASALVGGFEAISSGITTTADIASTAAAVQAMTRLGMRGIVYRETGAMDKHRVPGTMDLARNDIDRWRYLARNSLVSVGIAPAALHACNPLIFTEVSKLAKEENLPVAIHLAGYKEEFNFVDKGSSPYAVDVMDDRGGYVEIPRWLPTGVSPVQYAANWGAFDSENVLAIHCIQVSEEDVKKLNSCNVAVAMCPRINAQLGMGVAPYSEFKRAHMRVGLGPDSPAATDETDMLVELRLGMLLQRAVDPESFMRASEALELATLGGARALRMDDKIGSLEIGKQADIIAVRMDGVHKSTVSDPVANLVNTCNSTDVTMTMVAGNLLYENGEHLNNSVSLTDSLADLSMIRERLSRG